MLSLWQSILIIVLCVSLALTFLVLLRRLWDPVQRRQHNDLIGWQVGTLGTTFAVIMGFMLYTVWLNFEAAEVNAQQEANSLVDVFRLAEGLPPAQRDAIQKLAHDYAGVMVNEEWPAMNRGTLSPAGFRITQQWWTTIMGTEAQTRSEQTALDHALSELNGMTEHRRLRQLQSRWKLPGILWAVLIIGGVLTVASACLFGTENFRLHFMQVFALTLLISLVLVAIADIDGPFQGYVHVNPAAFDFARQTFDQLTSAPK